MSRRMCPLAPWPPPQPVPCQLSAFPPLLFSLPVHRPVPCIHHEEFVCRRLDLHYYGPVTQCVKSALVFCSVRVFQVSGTSLFQAKQPVRRPTPQFLPRTVCRQVYFFLLLSCKSVCWQALLCFLRPAPEPLTLPEFLKRDLRLHFL